VAAAVTEHGILTLMKDDNGRCLSATTIQLYSNYNSHNTFLLHIHCYWTSRKESLIMTGNIFPLPRIGQHIIFHILP